LTGGSAGSFILQIADCRVNAISGNLATTSKLHRVEILSGSIVVAAANILFVDCRFYNSSSACISSSSPYSVILLGCMAATDVASSITVAEGSLLISSSLSAPAS
jgi:hypothetical protein